MTTLTFNNTSLSVINQNNQTFLTANDLGLALEYTQPSIAVMKIYDRNADEFTAEMTALVEMQTAGGLQKVRIFSLRGAHLIAMFARTKIAKAFRKWVLDVLDEEVKKSTALLPSTITPEQQQTIQSAVQQAHHRTGLHWQEIYRQLKAMFHIAKYDQLPQDQYGNAMAFIMNLQPIVLPSVEKKFTFEFTEYELEQLVWLWCGHKQMNTLLGDMIKPLETIGSYFTGMVISHHQEYQRQYKNTLPTIQRLIQPFKASNRMNWERAKNLIAQ
ncbi:TPA: P22AR C-terminal domain-containing protein [Haemophilus influenzae]|uniref:P22AR C-terminal domain-containing protein n=1 Tax=Haemophilus influenzae TaxID=727 RepID=UPI000D7896BB|nr:P22AR C-terminal domain-containing protein [Haemophilus influenzae]BBE82087.1 hypothetical protein CHBNII1_07060 [Haemophilus influenzae]BBE84011.1 hypothetical protein CHBNII2_07060 [Haemophilus influenzae]GBK79700.1 hypothetical protein NTHIID8_18730 [Haemophilus influenzae]GBK91238.1 hypothetical protein NTHiID19_11950 [Haemophilus influenzae]